MIEISIRRFIRFRKAPGPLFGVGSTILAGLSNTIVQLLGATILSTTQFGLFVISTATAIFLLGLGRSLVGQVDLIRGSASSDSGSRGAAYFLGVLFLSVGGVVILISWFAGLREFNAFLAVFVGVCISGIFVIQDSLRFRAFREGVPKSAMFSDLAMVSTNAIGVSFLALMDVRHSFALLAVWALAIGVGLSVGHALLRYPFASPIQGFRWILRNRDLAFSGFGEYALQSGIPYSVNFIVLGLGGADVLAGFRLVQILFSSVSNVAVGVNSTLVPKLVEAGSPRLAAKQGKIQFALLTTLSITVLLLIFTLPTHYGSIIFGENWAAMGPFVIVGAVHGLVNALAVPNFSLLRILGFAHFSFWVRVGSSILTLFLVAIATWKAEPVLVAWALAAPAVLSYLIRVARVFTKLRRLNQNDVDHRF